MPEDVKRVEKILQQSEQHGLRINQN